MTKILSVSAANIGNAKLNQNKSTSSMDSSQISFEGREKKKPSSGLSRGAAAAIAAMAMASPIMPTTASAQTSSITANYNNDNIDSDIQDNLDTAYRWNPKTEINKYEQDANHYFYVVVPKDTTLRVAGQIVQDPIMIISKTFDATGQKVAVANVYPNTDQATAVRAYLAEHQEFTVGDNITMIDKNGNPVFVDTSKAVDKITAITIKPKAYNFTNLFNKKESGSTSGALDFMDGNLGYGTTMSVRGAAAKFDFNGLSNKGSEIAIKNVSKDKQGNVYISNFIVSNEKNKLNRTTNNHVLSEGTPTNVDEISYVSPHINDIDVDKDFVRNTVVLPGGRIVERTTTGGDYEREAFDINTTVLPATLSYRAGNVAIQPYATLGARAEEFDYEGFDSVNNQEIYAGLGLAAQYKNDGLQAGAAGEIRGVERFGDNSGFGTEKYARAYVRQFLNENVGVEVSGQYWNISEEEGFRGQAGLFALSNGENKVRVGAGVLSEIIRAGSVDYDKTAGYVSLDAALDKETSLRIFGTSDGNKDHSLNVGVSKKF